MFNLSRKLTYFFETVLLEFFFEEQKKKFARELAVNRAVWSWGFLWWKFYFPFHICFLSLLKNIFYYISGKKLHKHISGNDGFLFESLHGNTIWRDSANEAYSRTICLHYSKSSALNSGHVLSFYSFSYSLHFFAFELYKRFCRILKQLVADVFRISIKAFFSKWCSFLAIPHHLLSVIIQHWQRGENDYRPLLWCGLLLQIMVLVLNRLDSEIFLSQLEIFLKLKN